MKHLIAALTFLTLMAGAAMAQSNNYQISPGDTLSVEVLEDQALNRTLLVLPDGTINFPFAGTVLAGGRTVSQVQDAITTAIADNFAQRPTVFVTVAGVRPSVPSTGVAAAPPSIAIFFTGEVAKPGALSVEPGTRLLQAIALSGGFTPFAAVKRIQLRRTLANGQTQTILINYRALSNGAELRNNFMMQDGDVILAPERRLFE